MTLKLIPLEALLNSSGHAAKKKAGRHFNSGHKIFSSANHEGPFKNICLKLVSYINRGGRFTYDQIDELIMGLQRLILSLQKKKQELLRQKRKR